MNWHPQKRQGLTGISSQIDNDFISAQPDGSLNFITKPFIPWLRKAEDYIKNGEYKEAAEICADILEEIGYRYSTGEYWPCYEEFSPSDDVCLTAAYFIMQIVEQTSENQPLHKEIIDSLRFLTKYSYFEGKESFDIDSFVKRGCIFDFPKNWRHI